MKTVPNGGGFGGVACPKTSPVSYRFIVSKRAECTNLPMPARLSATHVAYGSIRMEPVFMIPGQSAGTAASVAINDKSTIQTADCDKLKPELLLGKHRL